MSDSAATTPLAETLTMIQQETLDGQRRASLEKLFENLSREFHANIVAFAEARLRRPPLAGQGEDIAQEVLIRLTQALQRGDFHDITAENWRETARPRLARWLYSTARYVISEVRRAAAARPTVPLGEYEPPVYPADLGIDSVEVSAAIATLSPHEREVTLLILHGWKSPEIAEKLGVQPSTIRGTWCRARANLRRLLTRPAAR